MPDEIKQVLGFDASPALQALQQLDSAMAQFEARLGSSSQAFGSFNKSAGRTVAALVQISKHGKSAASALSAVVAATNASASGDVTANAQAAASAASQMASSLTAAGNTSQAVSVKIGNALARVSAQSNATATAVKRDSERMVVSLSLLSRIVFTQAIVRALSTLRNAFRQTLGEAIEFQRRLALITTIDDSGASIEALAGSVRSISEEFNIPLLETAAGLYQTISNQIGDAAESQVFLAETAQFARATGSDLKNSVDLLSGALKAFQLNANETGRVAGIFFKTIDLGRVEADELANSFGRVGPVAAELGLSLEETSAALAAITIRGSKTSEALTQVRAITTALLKPSVAMQKALRELGFSSGEMAIRTLGLVGTLDQLNQTTEGSAAALAALFPNVRGLAGAASLTNDGLESLTNGIREMQDAGEEFSKQKFLQATATDADAVTKEINKLKNAFTEDLGSAALSAAASFSQLIGGADTLVKFLQNGQGLLVGFAGSLALVRAEAIATGRGLSLLAGGFGFLTQAAIAGGVGDYIGNLLSDALRETRNAQLKALEQASEAEIKLFEAKLKKQTDAANKADQERLQNTRKVFQELNKIYLQDADNAKRANDTLAANTKASLDNILSTREKLIDELARTSAAAVDLANDARARIAAGRERTDDRNFDREFAQVRGQSAQIEALLDRSEELAARAAKELKAGSLLGDPDRIAEAVRQFDKAQSIGEKALQIAGKNRFFQNEVYSDLEQLTARQRRAEEELIKAQERRQKALDEERKKQQAVVDAMRDQLKIALENTGIFDEQGNQFDAQEQARRDKARRDALKSIAEAALNQDDLSATAALGLADFVSRFENELARDPIRLQFTVENEITRIRNQMEAAFANFKIGSGVDVAGLEQALGKDFTTPDQLNEGLQEATKRAGELRVAIQNAVSAGNRAAELKKQLADIVEQLGDRGLGTAAGLVAEGPIFEGLKTISELRAQVNELTTSTNVSEEELEALRAKFLSFVQQIQQEGGFVQTQFFEADVEKLGQAFVKLQELKKLQAQSTVDPGLQSQLSQLEAVLAKQPGTQFANSAKAISSAAGPSAAIASAWERAAAAAERAAAAASRIGGPTNQAFGGMMHLATGGATRGIDTIPAMLSPGEFVMNARSSRKFYAQLQAMNAGLAPTFRENGGSVTNVGDIHIAVNGGQTATQTIREIGRGLRREIRRGTLDL